MPEITLDRITNFTAAIVSLSQMANDLTEYAAQMQGHPISYILVDHARDCRVAVLKAQVELAGCIEDFVIIYKDAPEVD